MGRGHKFVLAPIILLILVLGHPKTATAKPKHLTLAVGETIKLALPEAKQIDVSRRGILELFATSDGEWQITGMKSGLVLLTATDDYEGTIQRYLVTVGKGVDQVNVSTAMTKSQRMQKNQSGDPKQPVKAVYRLQSKILLYENNIAKLLGFKADYTVQLSKAQFESRLQDLKLESKVHVLSEPTLRLLPGIKADLVNGGEFQVIPFNAQDSSSHEENASSWKRTGLLFQVTVEPLTDQKRVRLDYVVDLRNRQKSAATLSINSAASWSCRRLDLKPHHHRFSPTFLL
jgi:Flp pilus assembly secretin CpaC